jgi:hypothetical protein
LKDLGHTIEEPVPSLFTFNIPEDLIKNLMGISVESALVKIMGTKRNAVWGYIHYGDKYEAENRELAARLIKAIASVTTLENRGVLLDSTTGRNDYRCKTTGKRGFYSLDENINTAPYRVLLEIGDNTVSREILLDPVSRKKMGEAIKLELAAWLSERKN